MKRTIVLLIAIIAIVPTIATMRYTRPPVEHNNVFQKYPDGPEILVDDGCCVRQTGWPLPLQNINSGKTITSSLLLNYLFYLTITIALAGVVMMVRKSSKSVH